MPSAVPATEPATEPAADPAATAFDQTPAGTPVEKTDAQWREELTPEEYRVLRQAGTERPYTGEYWDTHTRGVYKCRACGTELFTSYVDAPGGPGDFYARLGFVPAGDHDGEVLVVKRW